MKPHPIAILVSDIHLSHKPPVARSREPDWYAAMAAAIKPVKDAHNEYGVPVVCAGDVFDKPCPPIELIRFALDTLPPMYAVPGQHDLINHRHQSINSTAYGLLCHLGHITNIASEAMLFPRYDLTITGVGWGQSIPPPPQLCGVHLLVCHRYVYKSKSTCYQGAPDSGKATSLRKELKGYTAAVFGDNHIPFMATVAGCRVLNHGTLMRRSSAEKDYELGHAILYSDGSIVRQPHDIQEVFHPTETTTGTPTTDTTLAADLRSGGMDSIDFISTLKKEAASDPLPVRRIIKECIHA